MESKGGLDALHDKALPVSEMIGLINKIPEQSITDPFLEAMTWTRGPDVASIKPEMILMMLWLCQC